MISDNPRYYELNLERIRLQDALAERKEKLKTLQVEISRLDSELLAVRQDIHNLYQDNGQLVPAAHFVPELPSTPPGAPLHGSCDEQQRPLSPPPAARVPTQSTATAASLDIEAQHVDSSHKFPFAGHPPSWGTISRSADEEEPIGEQDEVLVRPNSAMLCNEVKCIVLLGSDWTFIWCPICGANCVDDQHEPSYFAGMAGLRAHMTKSHVGVCSGAYQKFIVDHGGCQSLSEDELADVRSRRSRPQFRAAFRADVGIRRTEAGVEEMSSDNDTATAGPGERVPRARGRPLFKQDANELSQEHVELDQAEAEESEPAHVTQHNNVDQSGTRPTRSTRSTRRIVTKPRRSASASESLDEGPISAAQKKQRRKSQLPKSEEFGEAPAEGVKRRSKSLAPGAYKEPRKDHFPWEDREEGEAS